GELIEEVHLVAEKKLAVRSITRMEVQRIEVNSIRFPPDTFSLTFPSNTEVLEGG
ncbi:unnamed protein product, partial [marine sediment metagenome]